jgi:hypothetical protein
MSWGQPVLLALALLLPLGAGKRLYIDGCNFAHHDKLRFRHCRKQPSRHTILP